MSGRSAKRLFPAFHNNGDQLPLGDVVGVSVFRSSFSITLDLVAVAVLGLSEDMTVRNRHISRSAQEFAG